MGLFADVVAPVVDRLAGHSSFLLLSAGLAVFLVLVVVVNVLRQVFFKNPNEPPVVFHWLPFVGSTITYGIEPFVFFSECQKKYGDIFTFVLLGRKMTVCLGLKGNEFILNGKLKDVCAEEIYSSLTTPVFGSDVVYDCPNAKLMEQKKFVKFGLTSEALRSYVPLISAEVADYLKRSPNFKGTQGTVDIAAAIAEITIFTASRSLQGKEVRAKFDSSFADLFHDLDMGFSPINFMLPWAPLPHNRKRDRAQRKIAQTYLEIIEARRRGGGQRDSEDMIWNLMSCTYKNGRAVPDHEIAHIMIALLMAGQHSSSSTSAWICLRLASQPEVMDDLLDEQRRVLGADLPDLSYDDLAKLTLHQHVVRETLRLHAPIHSIMRQVKSPMAVEGTPFVIPPSHGLLSAPGMTSRYPEYFPNPQSWDPRRWNEASRLVEEDDKVDYGYGLVSKGAKSPYLPFGAGRHRCIGEQFAYVQLTTILVMLVRHLRFENLPGQEGVVGTDYSSLFSRPISPALIQWKLRQNA